MFDNFTLAGLTISNLQAQVLGFLANPFVVAAIVAVLALFFGKSFALTLFGITGVDHALRQARWTLTNQEGHMRSYGEDSGDIWFWHDQEVTQGHVRPVFFRRSPSYRLQKHRRKNG